MHLIKPESSLISLISEVKNFAGTMTIDTINCPRPFVQSLKGIEYFQKMTKLIVWSSAIDSLSMTKTMALDTVRLYSNKDLQYVNVSGLTNMRFFKAINMPVVSLDLSNLPALEYVTLQVMGRLDRSENRKRWQSASPDDKQSYWS